MSSFCGKVDLPKTPIFIIRVFAVQEHGAHQDVQIAALLHAQLAFMKA